MLSPVEKEYFECIKSALPEGYSVYPQINLASIINRTDVHTFQNELFRNIDFGVFDKELKPVFLIEIQDKSHLNIERQNRDKKIKLICEEAGIAIVEFWKMDKVDISDVSKKIQEALSAPPIERKSNHKEILLTKLDSERIEVKRVNDIQKQANNTVAKSAEKNISNATNKTKYGFLKDFASWIKGALVFFSVMSLYYVDSVYKETGEKYQCFICAFIPIATTIIGIFFKNKGIKSTASIVVGALFSVLLIAFPFIYK